MALNPELRVIRLTGNCLDNANMAMLDQLAAEKDYQIWIEKVADDAEVGIIIEEGAVKKKV
jgi:hypothetical protein